MGKRNAVLCYPSQICFSRISKEIKMSECVDKDNMDAYTNLTDHVFHQILLSTDDHLEKVVIQLMLCLIVFLSNAGQGIA